jgi:hypothetical protein
MSTRAATPVRFEQAAGERVAAHVGTPLAATATGPDQIVSSTVERRGPLGCGRAGTGG